EGYIEGVLDATTTELADELVGGALSAGKNRLEAAGERGIPQVVAPGALDMVNFWAPETIPDRFRGRQFYQHNPQVTLMRTTKAENRRLGKLIAQKLNKAKGPTAFFWPKRGISLIDIEGKSFHDPNADIEFINSLKGNLGDKVKLVEMDVDINDKRFAKEMASQLIKYLENK
ncbi:Tm-1-like ATP-binding domain-containing protein, partial [Chloroflexota bacterium]